MAERTQPTTEDKPGKKITSGSAVFLLLVILLVFFNFAFFTVDETEQVVVLQFGNPVKTITEPGLYVKLPDPLQTITRFEDRRILSESVLSEILTSDKKNLVVDYYVLWEIDDPLLFLQTVTNEEGARYRISDIVYSNLRLQLGLYELKDIISSGRDEINEKIIEASKEKLDAFGVRVVDVKIRRIDFPEQNKYHVYDRMRSERTKMANKYRSEGEEEAMKIRAETDKQNKIILSRAYENASKIKGDADAEAAKIYARIYETDPEFYEFTRTLEAYKKILTQGSKTLIIPSDSGLFKHLNEKE